MTDADLHTLTGAYAADALPEDERAAFRDHLETCATCAQEVRELTATAARLATATTATAPASMRARVLSEIQNTRQLSPSEATRVAATGSRSVERPWFRQPLAWAASFLLVLSLGLAGVAVAANRSADRAQRAAAQIASVATDPDRQTLTAPISSGGKGVIVAAHGNAVFRAQGLASLPANRSYQLWVMDPAGGARSIAVLGPRAGSHVERFVPDVGPGDSVGLTVEPRNGSDAPTSPPVLLMTMTA
jgi:anti-sigma-K factor RskA